MKEKQIIVIASNFPPIGGGISRYLFEIFRYVPSSTIRVIGLPTPGWEEFDVNVGFPIKRLKIRSYWDGFSKQFKLLAPYYLHALWREKECDLILCGQAHHTLMLPAWIISKVRGIPYGVFTYGLDILSKRNQIHQLLRNVLLRNAQIVFVISESTGKNVLDCGVKPDRISMIRPPVKTDWGQDKITIETVIKRHKLGNKRVILTVSRLVERKGHDDIIRALPEIIKKFKDIHYLVVGDGPMETQLKALVRDLKLNDYVTFAGRIPDEELRAYYEVCEIFALVSKELPEKGNIEGFGIVYLEANLFGKPVVAANTGGVPDAVIHGKTGLLVEPSSLQSTADAIISLLNNPVTAQELGENGRRRALDEFNGEVAARKMLDSLSRLVFYGN